MPAALDPNAEARRIDTLRAALVVRQPWLQSTGPRTAAGKRRASANAVRHGTDSLSFRLAVQYLEVVAARLSADPGASRGSGCSNTISKLTALNASGNRDTSVDSHCCYGER
jgi:hypothetical protein